jgi:hypothetical protein
VPLSFQHDERIIVGGEELKFSCKGMVNWEFKCKHNGGLCVE